VSKKCEENRVESTNYGRLYSILILKQMFTLAKEVSFVLLLFQALFAQQRSWEKAQLRLFQSLM
jgi:hypothetical protein